MQIIKPDIEFDWLINYFCNFNCNYCFTKDSNKNVFEGISDIEKIVDGFNKINLTCLINITGGEPFLYPDFIKLCQKLTKKHILVIDTNLSTNDILKFTQNISPEKIRCIHTSLHITERERLGLVDDFIEKYKLLEKEGFYVFVTYVMHPSLIDRFKKDYDYFKSKGIILRPKLLRGIFDKLNIPHLKVLKKRRFFQTAYPEDYTKKEKERIIKYIDKSQEDKVSTINYKDDALRKGGLPDTEADKFFIDGIPSFKDKHCSSGKSFVIMTPEGDIHRCHSGKHYLGNLFKGSLKLHNRPTKCEYDKCLCPYIGYCYCFKDK